MPSWPPVAASPPAGEKAIVRTAPCVSFERCKLTVRGGVEQADLAVRSSRRVSRAVVSRWRMRLRRP